MIVSAFTNRALYVNFRNGANGGNGEVGTFDAVGKYGDQYFDLAQTQGTGVRNAQFRIHSPSGHGNLFSRTHNKPEHGCLSDTDKVYADHWFTFEMEPLKFIRIKYDEANPEMISTGIRHFPPQKADNHLDIASEQTILISEETEQQSTFTTEIGASMTASAEVSCGVPLFAEGKLSVSSTLSSSMAWGTTNITRQKWEASVKLQAPPKSAAICTASVHETRLRTPFVSYWKSQETCKEIQLKGIYEGQSCVSLHTQFSPLPYTPFIK